MAPKEFECDVVFEDVLLSRCRFHGGSTLADAREELEMDREELGAIPRYFVFLVNGTTPLAPRHETDRSVYESLASGKRLYIKQDLNTRDDEMNNGLGEQQYAPEQYNGTNNGMNVGMNGIYLQQDPILQTKQQMFSVFSFLCESETCIQFAILIFAFLTNSVLGFRGV